jgi:6-phosphogluconolactonase/glucosamine-6-phosphate isomerase/deaminase
MKIEVYADADTVARDAAKLIAKEAREAVTARGKLVVAMSGRFPLPRNSSADRTG